MKSPKVSIIVVNHNGAQHLGTFFDSLNAQAYPQDLIEVIFVDNDSGDDSIALAKSRYPSVKVITNNSNLGFAQANNQGAAIACGQYLAMLNNDMRLEPDWLVKMVDCLSESPDDVVCIGSRILNWDGTQVDFIGSKMTFDGKGSQTNHNALVGSKAGTTYPEWLLFACGGAMLIERRVYIEVGGFDDDYFAYFEDVDLGWRLWILGYRVGFCAEAVVYHRLHGTSSRFGRHKKIVLYERNALCSILKNYDDINLSKVLPAALLLAVKRISLASGIPKGDFAFTRQQLKTQVSLAPGSLEGLLRAFRELGLRAFIKRGLIKTARKLLEKLGDTVQEDRHAIWSESYAVAVALDEVVDRLPSLMEKRRFIQSRRKRSDQDLMPLFGEPFQQAFVDQGYSAAYESVLEQFGLIELFKPSHRPGADARP